ncbi:UbiA family prenyltransferase [Fulvivirgaceae bacterium PWU4]|uniref:UbiA family prenyltransferase n=1 Tax=Chryseosolibacter histidini TaxID=2782349 RepID=A0AAP2DLS4_9BACT|nr:UbiA family prenyltransferase [Chryseosolibacter histidini]MBT1698606.1 UbiA family prenyltransferase [Chryseosolibacter histidini]
MFRLSSWLHLRIPFSYFLLPVFLFSLCASPNLNGPRIGWVFFILHFLLYPASNGYNSYFDKDEKSIGGLKNPPPVHRGLYFLSLLFDALAIALGFLKINPTFAMMLLIYGLVSKAYSHPSVRLKKYAITGWIITGLFQGFFTFVMCYTGVNDLPLEAALTPTVTVPATLTSIMLWANYPMTQVYQHEEDAKRGDRTFSLMLGIKGTFYFAAIFFTLATIGFVLYLKSFFQLRYAIIFLAALSPVLVYFFYWFNLVRRDENQANHTHTMRLNFISATCLNAFFIYLFLDSSQVIQALQGGF